MALVLAAVLAGALASEGQDRAGAVWNKTNRAGAVWNAPPAHAGAVWNKVGGTQYGAVWN